MVAERYGLGKTGSGGLRQEGEKGVLGRTEMGGGRGRGLREVGITACARGGGLLRGRRSREEEKHRGQGCLFFSTKIQYVRQLLP